MKGKPKHLAVATLRVQSKINDYMEERVQDDWPRRLTGDIRVSGEHRTDVRATL